jgi:hypothetical protein
MKVNCQIVWYFITVSFFHNTHCTLTVSAKQSEFTVDPCALELFLICLLYTFQWCIVRLSTPYLLFICSFNRNGFLK